MDPSCKDPNLLDSGFCLQIFYLDEGGFHPPMSSSPGSQEASFSQFYLKLLATSGPFIYIAIYMLVCTEAILWYCSHFSKRQYFYFK